MDINKEVKRLISMTLILLITCSNLVFAKDFDYVGHTNEFSIKQLIEKGIVKGYAGGNFKPDNHITRVEFVTLINRAFGFTREINITYKDIKESHWAYNEFKKAVAAGYITGFEDGTLRPNNNVTRQELAVVISRLLDFENHPSSDRLHRFHDVSQIPTWSKGAIGALVERVYMVIDGVMFAPTTPVTRGDVAFTVDMALTGLVHVKDVTYSQTPLDDNDLDSKYDTVVVKLSGTPWSMVTEITRTINGMEDKNFKWDSEAIPNWKEDNGAKWSEENRKFTIDEIKAVDPSQIEQTVFYTVYYRNTAIDRAPMGVKSNAIVIEAKK